MLTDVIDSYTTGTYKVYRRTDGNYVLGRMVRSPEIDADASSVDDTLDTLTVTGHGLSTGDGPYYLSSDDTLPGGLEESTPYWVIVLSSSVLQLSLTPGGMPVDITDTGDGTHHIANYFMAPLSIQPAGGGIKDVPEGQHTEATFTVWSTVELKSREPGYEADLIEYNGELHRVDSVDYYGILSNHWKATITRETTP